MPSTIGSARTRSSQPPKRDIVVFWIVRDSKCAECGEKLHKGRFLRMEGDRPLCLACADLDHLVFLASGNAALTRRARKHSTLSPVVVRFSRTRKRYERQGVLVEEEALARAEEECLADADARQAARTREADRRKRIDRVYVAKFAEQIESVFPECTSEEREAIGKHACLKHSGRVGRSASAQRFDKKALELAVRAHVRHHHTDYDALLAVGMDRQEARDAVRPVVERVLLRWRCG